jgi:dTDP-4-dehydrorhamnose 3,5-epimerase
MKFLPTKLQGAFEVQLESHADERGSFARSWCTNEFESNGLNPKLAQCSISYNVKKGTLRGMHFQAEPYPEAKLVRCTRGALYDVVVDLRPESPTFREWIGIELTPTNQKMVYVPERCGHGFITLADETEVFYQITEFYHAGLSQGVRWDDPAFQIAWPMTPVVMSDRDRAYPDFLVAR